MAKFSRVWHPRWTRVFIIGLFVASFAIGASLGLENRHQPVALAAAAAPSSGVSRPTAARLIDTHASVPFFVIPQPAQYSPYGAPVSIPQIGVPAIIELQTAASQKPLVNCDLLNETISRTIIVSDDDGAPVAGAPVVFTVNRSDIEAPQLVSDVTGFDGAATLTVKVPKVSAADKSFATYSVLAQAFEVHATTPAASARFAITDFTCSGVAGGR